MRAADGDGNENFCTAHLGFHEVDEIVAAFKDAARSAEDSLQQAIERKFPIVPDLTGVSIDEAKRLAHNVGFRVEVSGGDPLVAGAAKVIAQHPPPNGPLARGGVVLVTIEAARDA